MLNQTIELKRVESGKPGMFTPRGWQDYVLGTIICVGTEFKAAVTVGPQGQPDFMKAAAFSNLSQAERYLETVLKMAHEFKGKAIITGELK